MSVLQQFNMSPDVLLSELNKAMRPAVDYADIYMQSIQSESWFLEEGIVKTGGFSSDAGFGFRVISDEAAGFAYSDDISLPQIQSAGDVAAQIARHGQTHTYALKKQQSSPAMYMDDSPLQSWVDAEKTALLKSLDAYARSLSPYVTQVALTLSGSFEDIWMLNSENGVSQDKRPLVHFSANITVQKNGRTEQASGGGGARDTYVWFSVEDRARGFVAKAVRQALLLLEAQAAPAGQLPVVLGPGWPAVLFHEAVGHGLEGDFNRKGSSVFSGRIGEKVASDQCTLVDHATMPGRRGSLSVDDEGVPGEETVLIENGVLKNYMFDRLNARLMNTQSTGNGRRESYASQPLPRMTNTYLRAGRYAPEEIIASVKRGIYALDFSGGQVDITSGDFVFSASEAYLIEDGKVTAPIKGATLVGNGPTVLPLISLVGDDLALDSGIGHCGKAGQTVPVGVGQSTLKVDVLTIGGVDA